MICLTDVHKKVLVVLWRKRETEVLEHDASETHNRTEFEIKTVGETDVSLELQ